MITTNVKELDILLKGGLPKGRLIEFVGESDSYKTTTALNILSRIEEVDMISLYITLKNDLSDDYINKFNIDKERFYLVNDNNYEIIKDAITNFAPNCDIIVIDALANINAEDAYKAAEKIIYLCAQMAAYYNTTFIIINQLICDINNKTNISFAKNMLNRYCSVRLLFKKSSVIVKRYEHVGHKINISPIKSKIGLLEPVTIKYLI